MKPKFTTEIIGEKMGVKQISVRGYGKKAIATYLEGQICEVTFSKDDKIMLSICINESGNVRITNCDGMFEHLFGTSIYLKNTRPWDKDNE